MTVAAPVIVSTRARWLPASDAQYTSPSDVTVMPYGPGPSGASNTSTASAPGCSRP